MNNNYNNFNNGYGNNQNMNNNFNNGYSNNQFVNGGVPQNNMPQQNIVPNANQGGFTGITPTMVNNQNPVNNQSTVVNNEITREEMNNIIEKNLPKIMKSNGSNMSSFIYMIIGGFFLLLGLVLFFVMEEDIKTLFLVIGIIMGLTFIPIGLVKFFKAGKYPIVNFEEVRQELYAPDCLLFKEVELFFTKNHLVKYGSGKFVLPYKEIALAYAQQHPQSTTTVNTGGLAGVLISGAVAATQAAVQMTKGTQDIVLNTKSGLKVLFFAHKRENEIMTILQEHNPNILFGNTKENRDAYKRIKKNEQVVKQQAMSQQMVANPDQRINMSTVAPVPQNVNMNQQPMMPQQMPSNPNFSGVNQGMNRPPMPQQPMNNMPNNGLYQRPSGGQPRSFSGNINDQSTFNRF